MVAKTSGGPGQVESASARAPELFGQACDDDTADTIASSPDVVVVLAFDHQGRLWLGRTPSGLLDVLAVGRAVGDEVPAEAAYRMLRATTGLVFPLDEFVGSESALAGEPAIRSFVGFDDRLDEAPVGDFRALTTQEIQVLLGRQPEIFEDGFVGLFDRVRVMADDRRAELDAAASRHPAAWAPRPKPAPLAAPHTIDLRLLGICQLRCAWCWGPEHTRAGTVTAEQWTQLLEELGRRGTRQVIFSGGEPMLSRSLRPSVEAAKRAGMSVTLSTNAIRLSDHLDVVALVDDIGIPLDGSTPEINELMRARSARFDAWRKAIDGVVTVQELRRVGHTDALITVRTVIARPNLEDIEQIPGALAKAGADLSRLRIKLYQVEPFGPHFAATSFERDWAVSAEEAISAASGARELHPEANIELQLYRGTVGRYFLIDPDGFATGTDEDEAGQPAELHYGNVIANLDDALDAYRQHQRQIASRR